MTTETIFPALDERLITVKELAAFLGVQPQTVRKWKEEGPRRFRYGKHIRYRESDVLEWLAASQEKWGN